MEPIKSPSHVYWSTVMQIYSYLLIGQQVRVLTFQPSQSVSALVTPIDGNIDSIAIGLSSV